MRLGGEVDVRETDVYVRLVLHSVILRLLFLVELVEAFRLKMHPAALVGQNELVAQCLVIQRLVNVLQKLGLDALLDGRHCSPDELAEGLRYRVPLAADPASALEGADVGNGYTRGSGKRLEVDAGRLTAESHFLINADRQLIEESLKFKNHVMDEARDFLRRSTPIPRPAAEAPF